MKKFLATFVFLAVSVCLQAVIKCNVTLVTFNKGAEWYLTEIHDCWYDNHYGDDNSTVTIGGSISSDDDDDIDLDCGGANKTSSKDIDRVAIEKAVNQASHVVKEYQNIDDFFLQTFKVSDKKIHKLAKGKKKMSLNTKENPEIINVGDLFSVYLELLNDNKQLEQFKAQIQAAGIAKDKCDSVFSSKIDSDTALNKYVEGVAFKLFKSTSQFQDIISNHTDFSGNFNDLKQEELNSLLSSVSKELLNKLRKLKYECCKQALVQAFMETTQRLNKVEKVIVYFLLVEDYCSKYENIILQGGSR
ncbi:MAG: hypothetical protein CSA81_12670 [Acidobacteria bacterium]|nr:MAG: hypothetical protein CSA81_12670 [Acidobacteriota bacterium]